MKWTCYGKFNVWEKKKRDVCPRLSIASASIALRVRFQTINSNLVFFLNGKIVSLFRYLSFSFCVLSFFFFAIEILITSFIVVIGFYLFFARLVDEIIRLWNEWKKKLFLLSKSHLSLVIIRLVFNKYSPWNIKIFISNQLIVFYWVIL